MSRCVRHCDQCSLLRKGQFAIAVSSHLRGRNVDPDCRESVNAFAARAWVQLQLLWDIVTGRCMRPGWYSMLVLLRQLDRIKPLTKSDAETLWKLAQLDGKPYNWRFRG
jgi:hypothetical protein